MKLYSVGEDELNEFDIKELERSYSVEWGVYHYTEDGYDGWGNLVFKTTDGKYFAHDFSHCSCFGPLSFCDLGMPEEVDFISMIRDIRGLENVMVKDKKSKEYQMLKKIGRIEKIKISELMKL